VRERGRKVTARGIRTLKTASFRQLAPCLLLLLVSSSCLSLAFIFASVLCYSSPYQSLVLVSFAYLLPHRPARLYHHHAHFNHVFLSPCSYNLHRLQSSECARTLRSRQPWLPSPPLPPRSRPSLSRAMRFSSVVSGYLLVSARSRE
jgi:hypothetical protein